MNKISAAEEILDGALKRNPNDVDALHQRATSPAIRKRGGSRKGPEPGAAFPAGFRRAHFGLAKVKHSQGLISSERQELLEAVNRNPYHLTARVALSHHFLTADDAKSALHVMEQTPPRKRTI